ncbi:MAG: hypothetical protein HFI34_12415 [Lachnospiraceae bacterium]|nr:hypothetical protein [Lachnospiraceae bacterium]
MYKNERIIVAIIGLIGLIVSAIIGAKWSKENVSVTVNIGGESVILKDNDIQDMANDNEELKNKISDYEQQINDFKNKVSDYEKQIDELTKTKESLSKKLGLANGALEDVPVIEYQNYGLSIDGDEKTINTDKSSVSINGRRYYSKDFVDNLLPDNKSAIEKNNILYIGTVIKEKTNLFDRQIIDKSDNVSISTDVKDTFGNMHSKAVVFTHEGTDITINANREYSHLKFKIAVLDEYKGGGIIQIETEQGIIYTSNEILNTTEPTEIIRPINQASKIIIRYLGSDHWNYTMVTDAFLYNEE